MKKLLSATALASLLAGGGALADDKPTMQCRDKMTDSVANLKVENTKDGAVVRLVAKDGQATEVQRLARAMANCLGGPSMSGLEDKAGRSSDVGDVKNRGGDTGLHGGTGMHGGSNERR